MKIKRAVLPIEKIRDFFESESFKTKKESV